ncbi:MAG: hypothetical protein ABSC17_05470 [Thermacetogeniaceae bacterium]
MIAEFILAAVACIGTLTATLAVYFRYQGDSEIVFDTRAARDYRVTKNTLQRTIRCRCLIPLANRGRQNGMVINVFCQPMYYGKIMEQLEIAAKLRPLDAPLRQNGYWEAVIIKKNAASLVELEVAIRSRADLHIVAREIPHLKVIIYYQVVGRDGIQWHLSEVQFDLAS